MQTHYLSNIVSVFHQYKELAEKAVSQMDDAALHREVVAGTNSVALIVHHMSGNMLSRWTDFLTSDGEKEWRKRDAEFEEGYASREEMMKAWEAGWQCLFHALDGLYEEDLKRSVYIRSQALTVMEAINRQLAHYSYHVGQIVFLAKLTQGDSFQSLSIPKGKSGQFNQQIGHK